MRAKPWSNPSTTDVVFRLLQKGLPKAADASAGALGIDWSKCKVADVGAGRGHFSHRLGEQLRQEVSLDPALHIFACDLFPESF